MSRVLAVITARGGSKGIPRKNLRMLAGKPLIAHTIDCALALGSRLHGVVLSTDDPEIAEVGRQYGAQVPFLRPAELARDETPTLPVIQHATSFVENRDGVLMDWILTLQPTSPLRTSEDLSLLIEAIESGSPTSAVTVVDADDCHPIKIRVIEDGWLRPYVPGAPEAIRRQDITPPVYKRNGAGYLTRRDILMERDSLYGERIKPVPMPKERSIDIDSELDLHLAELLLARASATPTR